MLGLVVLAGGMAMGQAATVPGSKVSQAGTGLDNEAAQKASGSKGVTGGDGDRYADCEPRWGYERGGEPGGAGAGGDGDSGRGFD